MISLAVRQAISIVVLLVLLGPACSQGSSPRERPQATQITPLTNFVDFDEAESALGIKLIFPDYVPTGLALIDRASLTTTPEREASATVFYALNGSLPAEEIVVGAVGITQWAPSADPYLQHTTEAVTIGATTVALSGYPDSPESHVAVATWTHEGQTLQVIAFGGKGTPAEVVRMEALEVVRSMLE